MIWSVRFIGSGTTASEHSKQRWPRLKKPGPLPFSRELRSTMSCLARKRVAVTIGAVVTFAVAASGAPSRAADVANGRKIAAVKCALCHGLDGQTKQPEAPNLSGQVEMYIAKELDAFRKGERKDETMSLVAKTLSDTDVADLAAYYSAIEVKIGKVPGD
jgi:cytochrome c553